MNIERYLPTDALRPFVKTMMIVESEDGMDSRVLPDTSLVLAFRLRGRLEQTEGQLPASSISGLRKSLRLIGYARDTAVLLVNFREGGAGAFFREPLHDLFGANIPLDCLISRSRVEEVEECLTALPTNRRKIALVERFLISEMKMRESDLLVLDAVRRIQAGGGSLRIRELASALHISQDPLEKRFRRAVGASPKQFSSIVRLRGVIEARPSGRGLSEAAHAAGYFDQSHFIKDFKTFTGQSPQVFFEGPPPW
ncbi:hypothetical protein CCAX7_20190 [Capsulimonas corticalis]|uniref:Uncharacterized protein n=1 Tax=Capsulimonas corticalis TaxID=2219043 RepID=A0A402D2F3_9BACT|nr:helix-turn-helix domain-containing protein [Capsulimonas corticalis]BDI29968.1 hypothetical protein CCAX7_20190 [Capsulimonas corticalis]